MARINEDIESLVELGLNRSRLEQHTQEEIDLAMCAIQESGRDEWDPDLLREMGLETEEKLAAHYAESALGW